MTYANRVNMVKAILNGLKDDGEIGENDLIDKTVENLFGGLGGDILTGDDADNFLNGGPGVNSLDGDQGTDICLNGPSIVNCSP